MERLTLENVLLIDGRLEPLHRILMWLPILGWVIADQRWKYAMRPERERMRAILESRSGSTINTFRQDADFLAFVGGSCEIIRDEIGWPNDRFISEDDCGAVLWAYDDGLDDVLAVIEIEEKFNLAEVPDAEFEGITAASFGEFLEAMYSRKPRQIKSAGAE
jgi:hypothetical protein